MIKLIVSDIDGTLVDSQGQLLPATITGVQAAVARGAQMVLASARSPKGMFGIAQQLGINSTMIAYNGALTATTDVNDRLTVFEEQAVDPKLAQAVQTVVAHAPHVTDLGTWLQRMPTPVHKMMIMADPDIIQAIEQRLSRDEFSGLAVYRSKETYLEIVAAGVTKAAALMKLLQDDQVTPAETIAFGDNFNDVAMLQTAGIGVAMANAPQPVKEAANIVTTDNNHNGIQLTLAQYFADVTR
ncbi:Cof-type HAD-IIB family hydrolase [Lactiplantibacillus plantarum]|uniref:Cof-type HAD-IIB family hydrolase n=1 Tax=Lactiplantibacillus plantarum TaxID=1590 RepID=UPI0013030A3C|nr:Cof-type HAD-IIB family hydrolase [Lactiplantibacillus plantarum]